MFEFVEVKKTTDDVKNLYKLLEQRSFQNISHKNLPGFEEHKTFVENHPYRVWYLVMARDQCVGSVYLLNDNCLGLTLLEPTAETVREVLGWILGMHKPLPPIKSVRPKDFFINVAPKNKALRTALEQCMASLLQISYTIDEQAASFLSQEKSDKA